MTAKQRGDYRVNRKKDIRSLRMNEAIRDLVARAIVEQRCGEPRLMYDKITISYVDTSSDLRFARINFSVIGTEQEKQQQTSLMQNLTRYFRKLIADELPMRYVPNIELAFDKSLEAIDKILQYEQEYGNYASLDKA